MPDQPHQAPFATASDSPTPDPKAGDDAYISVLNSMIEVGADLVRMVHHEAKARMEAARAAIPPYPVPPCSTAGDDLTLAYERITRSVRRNILLARKLADPSPAAAAQVRVAARKRIIREVEDAIEDNAANEHEAETLQAELLDRLDSPDLEDEIANRTIPEIVTDMCRDFGIAQLHGTHPWRRRTPHDIATLCARAAGLALPASPQIDKMAQQRPQQAQRDPAEPRTTQSAAQGYQQTDTG